MAGESAAAFARRQRVKASRLMRLSERWAKGAEGERTTAAELEALPQEEWRVLHDVPWPGRPRANIDHILIGPAGVFVVDSRNWSGPVSVRGGVLRLGKYSREGAVASVEEAARAVARLLRVPSGRVRPVLCLVRKDPIVAGTRGVTVCSTASIADMLESRPRSLTEFDVRALAIELEPHRVRPKESGRGRRGSRARRPAPARRRGAPQRSGALIGALAALSVAVTLAVSPQLVTDLTERVTRFFVHLTDSSGRTEVPEEAPTRDDVRPGRTDSLRHRAESAVTLPPLDTHASVAGAPLSGATPPRMGNATAGPAR